MRLWTLQGKDFKIESTTIVHTKSDYYNDTLNYPNIQRGYHRLSEYLETDKFLWCFPLQRFHHESDKILYELEVPEEEIMAFVAGCAWHKLITNCRTFYNRNCIDLLWERKNDVSDYKAYIEQQNKKCFSREPEEQLWDRLFWPQPTKTSCPAGIKMQLQLKKQMCTALIKSPVDEHWIINKV